MWHRLRRFAGHVVGEIRADRMPGLAAEAAFWAVLSLFPALLVLTALLSWLDVLLGAGLAERARDIVVGTLQGVLTERSSGFIDAVRDLFDRNFGGALTVGFAGAVWSMSRGFSALILALNVAYEVDERRAWLARKSLALALGVGTVLVCAISAALLLIGPLFGGGRFIAEWLGLGKQLVFVWNWLRVPIAVCLLIAWLAAIYVVAPHRRTRFREQVPGAAVAVALWVLVTGGFAIYTRIGAWGNPVIGVLGGALVVMLWMYAMAFAVLVGGEINSLLTASNVTALGGSGADAGRVDRQSAPGERRHRTSTPSRTGSAAVGIILATLGALFVAIRWIARPTRRGRSRPHRT
jgi:membrane protein